ncbi:MAG TPA: sensor domain-containing diguanylate cyclase [Kofleriaceae bacterium]|nr:sensor domain-containing diguanylate cyclase [Kofleriaceae bacterium]
MPSPIRDAQPARGRTRADLAFMIVLGLGGWILLAIAGQLEIESVDSAVTLPFGLFLVVVVAARGLAFELMERTVVSLDSAFYVAAAICLGPLQAGRMVALALTVDSLIRLARAGSDGQRAPLGVSSLAYVLYFGGMTGALLAVCGWIFGLAHGTEVLAASTTSQPEIMGLVFGLGATLLVAHYTLQGVHQVLAGRRLRAYLHEMAVPGIVAEASLLPLAVVVVLVYQPDAPLGFTLLGATYLLVNFVVNRLSRASARLRARVTELETLNGTARSLAESLDARGLVESVARETLRSIPGAERLVLTSYASSEGFEIATHDAATGQVVRERVNEPAAGARWVLDQEQPLVIGARPGESGAVLAGWDGPRSWLGVPLVMYGNVEGVLAVSSHKRGVFGADQRRLLEAIASQVSVALQNAHLYELAMVDGLTSLFVRRYFDARLDEETRRAERFGNEFSLIMMDIDDFKTLNDTYGHPVGDRVLREIAATVRTEMRGVDTAARYGGEEFAMILPRTEMLEAYNQAERIRAKIAGLELEAEGKPLRLTASFGIASYPASDASNAADLVRCADRALYRAKRTGKNRVELYWTNDAAEGSRLRSV